SDLADPVERHAGGIVLAERIALRVEDGGDLRDLARRADAQHEGDLGPAAGLIVEDARDLRGLVEEGEELRSRLRRGARARGVAVALAHEQVLERRIVERPQRAAARLERRTDVVDRRLVRGARIERELACDRRERAA